MYLHGVLVLLILAGTGLGCATCLAETRDELALTGNAGSGQDLAWPYTVSPADAAPLFDGCLGDQSALVLPDGGTVTVRFAERVLVTRVAVSYYNDRDRAYNGAESATIRLTAGDQVLTSAPVPLDTPMELQLDSGQHLHLGGRTEWRGEALVPADTVEIAVAKHPSSHQVTLQEVQVWGLPARLAKRSGRSAQPVPFTAEESTCCSIRVCWSDPPPDTAYLRIRYRAAGARAWAVLCCAPSTRHALLFPLAPDTTHEVALDAVGAASAATAAAAAAPVTVGLPPPLALRTVADAFGTNFFPSGGAGYTLHPNESANTLAMLRLMRDAGVRHVRWWVNTAGTVRLFAEYGLTLLPSAANPHPSATGAWLVHTENEPDFVNRLPEEIAQQIRDRRAALSADDPRLLLAAPEIGGDLVGPGAEYLRAIYQTGVADLFQAVSVHPYMKTSCPTPLGGTPSCPESLVPSVRSLREVMREFGDDRKPILATECIGYGTYEGTGFPAIPPVTPARQLAWLIRSHLLMLGLGLARIYQYPFQDEGTDPAEIVDTAGLVDWHGTPKPLYAAYRQMTRLLGPTRAAGLQPDVRAPVFGARFREPNGSYLTALWDCGGESHVVLHAGAHASRVSRLLGDALPLPPTVDGRLTLTLTEDPLWVHSTEPLRVLSQERLAPPLEPELDMTLRPALVNAQPGTDAEFAATVSAEGFDQSVVAELSVLSPWTRETFTQTVTVPAGRSAEAHFAFPCPPTADRHRIHSWGVVCRYGGDREFQRHLFLVVRD